MAIEQLSIFVENKKGRLAKITELLAKSGVDIRALSIADTTDYGILRLIVDAPEKACLALKQANVTVSVTPVLGVSVSDTPGAFARVTRLMADYDVEIEYAYAFITPAKGEAYVILRVDDIDRTKQVLCAADVKIITQEDIFG